MPHKPALRVSFAALLRALPCNTGSVMLKPFPSMDCDDVDARLPVGVAGTIIFCGGIPGNSPKLVCDATPADADDRRSRPMVGYGSISLACVGSCGSLFPCPVPLEETQLLTLVLPYSQVRRDKVHQHGASHSVAHATWEPRMSGQFSLYCEVTACSMQMHDSPARNA